MTTDTSEVVSTSRRIAAPAAEIFQILSDPKRHLELDGTGMLRGAVTETPVTGVGDVFVMKMFFERLGDYEMNNHVVEFEQDRRIGWEPEAGNGHPEATADDARWGHRWSFVLAPDGAEATTVTELYDCSRAPQEAQEMMDGGRMWLPGMEETLQRLDQVCTGGGTAPLR